MNVSMNMKKSKVVSQYEMMNNSVNNSANSMLINLNNKGFKSFSQIQQQRRLSQTRLKRKALQNIQNPNQQQQSDIMFSPSLLTHLNNPSQHSRQSRMMQKYLSKLAQQKRRQSQLILQKKSYNFSKIKIPQKYPIHRYYEYDYNGEKVQFQNQISEKLSGRRSIILGVDGEKDV